MFRRYVAHFGFELSAAAGAILSLESRLPNRSVAIYLDNNAALSALICGDSAAPVAANLIALLWHIVAHRNISIWFERVTPTANIADLPSRRKPLPFTHRSALPLPAVGASLASSNEAMEALLYRSMRGVDPHVFGGIDQ